jgi:hypothetical protein
VNPAHFIFEITGCHGGWLARVVNFPGPTVEVFAHEPMLALERVESLALRLLEGR